VTARESRPAGNRAAKTSTTRTGKFSAHALYARGLHVFPVDHPRQPKCIGKHGPESPCDGTRGKHPAVKWSVWAATNTPDMIDLEWDKHGGLANIGIACGPSNIVVLDEDAYGEIERWCAAYGVTLPDTYAVTTSRGRHLYFSWDHTTARIGNSPKAMDGFKIDVRGHGGFVIAEGSRHESGVLYTGNGSPVAELPEQVAELLLAGDRAGEGFSHEGVAADLNTAPIPHGARHKQLTRYAGRLRKSGLDYQEAEPTFLQRWLCCEQPEGQVPEARFHSGTCPDAITWEQARATLRDVFGRYPAGQNLGDDDEFKVTLVPASEIVSDIPDWVWEREGLGRIQQGVLTLFAGRPGAGKSTAARYFAAQLSRGTLDGCWKGKPQKGAYIASEESLEQVVKPGLQLAGADMSNIVFPRVTFNGEAVALMSHRDETQLTEQLEAQGVTVIFVDPIMATIRSKVDIYRNNELRQALAPWVRIAKRINGIVVGVVHLVKGNNGDVVAAVNGSSAFGEVARCVFGFAKDPQADDGGRVMSQVKNACGVEDLSLDYQIDVKAFTADTGRNGLMPVFAILGDSDTTVSEVMSTVASKLRSSTQAVLNFVNSRTETGAEVVVDAGLAKTLNTAQKVLRRLFERGYIDNPTHGCYCPKMDVKAK
jgi:Bifunctional DNA primase/polymerase, N-terminal/AAA domain